jgi:hypothetical protein
VVSSLPCFDDRLAAASRAFLAQCGQSGQASSDETSLGAWLGVGLNTGRARALSIKPAWVFASKYAAKQRQAIRRDLNRRMSRRITKLHSGRFPVLHYALDGDADQLLLLQG